MRYWVFCAINKGGFFEIAFVVVVVDTHLPRFEALANALPHFDALTHVVIRDGPRRSSLGVANSKIRDSPRRRDPS